MTRTSIFVICLCLLIGCQQLDYPLTSERLDREALENSCQLISVDSKKVLVSDISKDWKKNEFVLSVFNSNNNLEFEYRLTSGKIDSIKGKTIYSTFVGDGEAKISDQNDFQLTEIASNNRVHKQLNKGDFLINHLERPTADSIRFIGKVSGKEYSTVGLNNERNDKQFLDSFVKDSVVTVSIFSINYDYESSSVVYHPKITDDIKISYFWLIENENVWDEFFTH